MNTFKFVDAHSDLFYQVNLLYCFKLLPNNQRRLNGSFNYFLYSKGLGNLLIESCQFKRVARMLFLNTMNLLEVLVFSCG